MLDGNFIEKLQQTLKADKELLYTASIDLLEKATNTPYNIAFASPYFGEEQNIRRVLGATLLADDNPYYRVRFYYEPKGLIDFDENNRASYYHGTFLPWHNKSQTNYWLSAERSSDYRSLEPFACFIERIVTPEQFQLHSMHTAVLNTKAWINYYRALFNLFLQGYSFNPRASGAVARFTKQISPTLYLAVEYDENHLEKVLKLGGLDFPKATVTILTDKCDRKLKPADYNAGSNENIFTLSYAAHPVFSTMPLLPRVLIAQHAVTLTANNHFQVKSVMQSEPAADSMVRMFGPEDLGREVRKQAFFYMDVYSFYLMPYLHFLEKSVLKVTQ